MSNPENESWMKRGKYNAFDCSIYLWYLGNQITLRTIWISATMFKIWKDRDACIKRIAVNIVSYLQIVFCQTNTEHVYSKR